MLEKSGKKKKKSNISDKTSIKVEECRIKKNEQGFEILTNSFF